MNKNIRLFTPEEIAAEEKIAAEHGMTIFRYRQVKKLGKKRMEIARQKAKETLKRKAAERKEQMKEINKLKGIEKRKKTCEKKRLKREKEKLKEKERLKKQKEKEKLAAMPKKKKMGRPRKRGKPINFYKRRKKMMEAEKKKSQPKKRLQWNYKIVACKNGKQIKYIGKYVSSEKAYEKINELLKTEIIFPQKYTHRKTLDEARYEYLILCRKTGEIPMLRNEYGKMVEQITTSEIWDVFDKFKYDVEETFWVWGYNNLTDRKTFKWIYDNLLVGGIESQYDIIRVALYKNKIVFLHDNDFIDLINCKTADDAIRFYNLLEEYIKKDKVRQVFFVGSYNQAGDKKKWLEEKLIELTGWRKDKLQTSSTIFHLRK